MRPIGALTLALLLAACATPDRGLTHDVYLSLRDPTPDRVAALVDDCRALRAIPGVADVVVGPRAAAFARPVNDRAFDVGLRVVLRDADVYRAYEEHPTHRALVEHWTPELTSLRVFDWWVDAVPATAPTADR